MKNKKNVCLKCLGKPPCACGNALAYQSDAKELNTRVETLTVTQSLPMERLDSFLRSNFPALSRGAIQRLLAGGHIRINGKPTKASHHPRSGEVITIEWPQTEPSTAQPQEIALEILFEDEHLLVVNKPAGLVVHPAAGHPANTLVNALLHHCGASLSGIGGVARPGIVHRLDKETSGCLVVAKNDAAHLALSAQFAGRRVQKGYEAIVCGQLPPETALIDAPIARHPVERKRMAVVNRGGRPALTAIEVLENLGQATLIQAQPQTGRTHQVRVHLQHIGFPVAGDRVYGRRQTARLEKWMGQPIERQMLHAAKLVLDHPRSGQSMLFRAPRPQDFTIALRQLRLCCRQRTGEASSRT